MLSCVCNIAVLPCVTHRELQCNCWRQPSSLWVIVDTCAIVCMLYSYWNASGWVCAISVPCLLICNSAISYMLLWLCTETLFMCVEEFCSVMWQLNGSTVSSCNDTATYVCLHNITVSPYVFCFPLFTGAVVSSLPSPLLHDISEWVKIHRSASCVWPDMIRDAILTCARKPTWVSFIYCTETTTKKCKTEKLKSKKRNMLRSNSKRSWSVRLPCSNMSQGCQMTVLVHKGTPSGLSHWLTWSCLEVPAQLLARQVDMLVVTATASSRVSGSNLLAVTWEWEQLHSSVDFTWTHLFQLIICMAA